MVGFDVCVIRYGDLCLAVDAQLSGLNRPKLGRCVLPFACFGTFRVYVWNYV
uniref:Uncharacterized protein n=1 Tax=Zea mays TaxID=4577 RepID=B4FDG1_MAIZE|nr:unknown [Zea mays]